jgi:hypothetical protein
MTIQGLWAVAFDNLVGVSGDKYFSEKHLKHHLTEILKNLNSCSAILKIVS